MNHRTTPRFWKLYRELPEDIREIADKNYELLKANPRHPSLQFKKIGRLWSARVGSDFRVLGLDKDDTILWIWIGPHDEYKQMIARQR